MAHPRPDRERELAPPGWRAELHLNYARRDTRTVLAARRHCGPLAVQKSLYPEGDGVCHNVVLHPPAGVVGGDELLIEAQFETGSHAVLTTPGASKWYRSPGISALQDLRFHVASGATLEWLPQETILFDGAHARLRTEVLLDPGARYLGWEVICLGRRASGEAFASGCLAQVTEVRCANRPLWLERGRLTGGDPLLRSVIGVAGFSVVGTFVAAGSAPPPELIAALRTLRRTGDDRFAVTALRGVVIARYLGHSAEQARQRFVETWEILRPALVGRPAQLPRIWRT